MKRFIKELRRREVFRTAGLYVGICWILIEVASVVLPTFDAPGWLFQAFIVVAIAGFPVMLLFAWIFDVSKEGISVQADPTDTIVEQLGARKTDFVVIGVLMLALVISVYINVKREGPAAEALAPVSLLVADFDNAADDPLFKNVLEDALVVGIEVAPHVTAYGRNDARQIGRRMDLDGNSLGLEVARRIAQSEGIKLLLVGRLAQVGSGYRISVDGVDVVDGQRTFTVERKADSRETVLAAIGKLSAMVRKKLSDTTIGEEQNSHAEIFVAASLEAAQAYAEANEALMQGRPEEAADRFRQAVTLDPKSARAFANLALAEFALGQTNEADGHWAKALALADTMTEREYLRILGRYYASVLRNNNQALETYAELVEKYPADTNAHSDYAVAAFRQLDFRKALAESRKALQIYPTDKTHRANLALYAMYFGDWETAATESAQVIAADAAYETVYLPMAIAALARGHSDAARDAYKSMSVNDKTGHGASTAELGLADIDLYFGRFAAAEERLRAGIDSDIAIGDDRAAAVKYIALAQSLADQKKFAAATAATAQALQLADGDALTVPAAMIYLFSDDRESAGAIAERLTEKANAHSQAYGKMLQGMILESEGKRTEAVLALREALGTADLWLIRNQLGRVYLQAGYYTEALDELMTARQRNGEASAVFLDGMPTYRYLAELPYWIGRAQEELKMRSAAQASYEEYVALRPQGGTLAQDASERAARLN